MQVNHLSIQIGRSSTKAISLINEDYWCGHIDSSLCCCGSSYYGINPLFLPVFDDNLLWMKFNQNGLEATHLQDFDIVDWGVTCFHLLYFVKDQHSNIWCTGFQFHQTTCQVKYCIFLLRNLRWSLLMWLKFLFV